MDLTDNVSVDFGGDEVVDNLSVGIVVKNEVDDDFSVDYDFSVDFVVKSEVDDDFLLILLEKKILLTSGWT